MPELTITEGEYYLRRDGEIRGPVRPNNSEKFPWRICNQTYTINGNHFLTQAESSYDLIEHIPRTDPRHPEYQGPQDKQWWRDKDGRIVYIVGRLRGGTPVYEGANGWCNVDDQDLVEHLPDCTGFDWSPEPEPALTVTAGWWLTECGKCYTLDDDLQSTVGVELQDVDGDTFRRAMEWHSDGRIVFNSVGGIPEDDFRIIGPAPEPPAVQDGYGHLDPPEYRPVGEGELFISKDTGEVMWSPYGKDTDNRFWIVRPVKPKTRTVVLTSWAWKSDGGEVQATCYSEEKPVWLSDLWHEVFDSKEIEVPV